MLNLLLSFVQKHSSRTKPEGLMRLKSVTLAYFLRKSPAVRLPSKPCFGMGFALYSALGAS